MGDASDRAKGDPRGRIPFYYPLLVAGLVLLLALAGMAYAWTMRNLFPAMELARIPTAEERGEVPVRKGPRRRLRLIQPASNIACAERLGFDLWSQVERWRELSTALGFVSEIGGIGRVPATP
ncbi:MAG: hypothetical protein JRG95_22705, partial [Deltaproteobacteria bacterium]|nr:hypothetical protein [Deltaproteobacteria bacterium]